MNPKISEDLIKIQSKLATDGINKTLQAIAGGTGNPVSDEEARKLQGYVERARINDDILKYFDREVKPFAPDAWIDESYTDL